MPSLTQKLDQILIEEENKRKTRERSGKFSPSSFGYCIRKQVFNRANIPQSNAFEVRTLRVFKAGKLFHDFFQGLLTQYESEVKIENEDICGYADIVIKDEKTVVDIKSMHSRGFWHLSKGGEIKTEKYHNILQLMTYVYLLGYDKGKLILTDKDTLCIQEYDFSLQNWKDEVEKELSLIKSAWENYQKGTLPAPNPRVFGTDKKTGTPNECMKYCNFRDYCFQLQGKPIPKTINDSEE